MALSILYIGGTGQISYCCIHESLAAGHAVAVYNRGTSGVALPDAVERITGDIGDPAAYGRLAERGFDVVCQFRAFRPEDISRDLALFAGKTGQYVFISSASAYEKPPRHYVVTEDVPLVNPYWEYSRLKAECEALLAGQSRLPFTIVRPSHTVRTRLPTIFGEAELAPRRMRAGKPVVIAGDGTSLWTVTRAEDFAPPFVRLLGNPRALGEAFHITGDRAFTWTQIYEAIGRGVGAAPAFAPVPTRTLLRYRPDWEGPLIGDKINSLIFDNAKVKAAAGDFAASTDIDEILAGPLAATPLDGPLAPELAELDALFDRIAADQARVGP